jgi:N-acetylmuramoyl-L-alanine amidase/putative cell wall-binding protein
MQSNHYATARIAKRIVRIALTTFALTAALAAASPASAATIFLDPGHGGRYPGAVYGGVEEQYVNLLIARETRAVLTARGHTVKMSRTGDTTVGARDRATWHWDEAAGTFFYYADGRTGVYSYNGGAGVPYDDLQARCDAANASGADLFVSIHNNAGGTATGTETYYNTWACPTDAVLSRDLATFVHEGVVASAGTASRKVDDVGYYVVRWTNMPAALIEVGFLSNPRDRARLLDPAFRRRVAVGIANGIERYLATDPYRPREPRIAGADRYATAAAASAAGWPDGAETVILASGESWPDSLAAAPLSGALDAPLLLTPSASLASPTAAEIARLRPERIVVLGGESALAPEVAAQAAAAASLETTAVTRIAGDDRYQTAALIAERIGAASGTVVVVSGEAYADAVSASAFAAMQRTPVLLTRTASLSPEVSRFLAARSEEVTRAVVVGGPAVVSRDTVGALTRRVAVEWLWGADRYATNRRVLERFWPSGALEPVVALATNFPDAVAAGPLAGKRGQPVVLCGTKLLSPFTREWVLHNADRIGPFTMMGGPGALSYLLEWELDKARGDRAPVGPTDAAEAFEAP